MVSGLETEKVRNRDGKWWKIKTKESCEFLLNFHRFLRKRKVLKRSSAMSEDLGHENDVIGFFGSPIETPLR